MVVKFNLKVREIFNEIANENIADYGSAKWLETILKGIEYGATIKDIELVCDKIIENTSDEIFEEWCSMCGGDETMFKEHIAFIIVNNAQPFVNC